MRNRILILISNIKFVFTVHITVTFILGDLCGFRSGYCYWILYILFKPRKGKPWEDFVDLRFIFSGSSKRSWCKICEELFLFFSSERSWLLCRFCPGFSLLEVLCKRCCLFLDFFLQVFGVYDNLFDFVGYVIFFREFINLNFEICLNWCIRYIPCFRLGIGSVGP